MKCCPTCGYWNFQSRVIYVCDRCSGLIPRQGTIYPPRGESLQEPNSGNIRTSSHTPRQRREQPE